MNAALEFDPFSDEFFSQAQTGGPVGSSGVARVMQGRRS
jgi:hypothetical protein